MATEQQKTYAKARVRGASLVAAAQIAGYADSVTPAHIEEGYDVQRELARVRAEAAANAKVTKEDVVNGFRDAAMIAKVLDDATGMVAAWRELGKLLGFYAPEVKKIEKGINKADLMKAMDSLSDEELLRLSRGRVIEGEATHVGDGTPDVPAVQA